jgi:hypothetical protein
MANDLTRESDRLLEEGRSLLRDNQAGGRFRRMRQRPIGRGSAELRQKNLKTRIKLIGGSLLAIVFASMLFGIALDGIGFTGIMVAFLAVVACTFLFSNFPKVTVRRRSDLNTGDVRHMVGRTELWLESQRAALPPPAVTLVDKIGVQLEKPLPRIRLPEIRDGRLPPCFRPTLPPAFSLRLSTISLGGLVSCRSRRSRAKSRSRAASRCRTAAYPAYASGSSTVVSTCPETSA